MTIEDLKLVHKKLHPNNLEAGLPGRETHTDRLYNFFFERLKIRRTTDAKRAKVESGQVANIKGRHNNKTMFICGVPGTGKTATVMYVIERLRKLLSHKTPQIHPFEDIYINGQHLATPEKIYSAILHKLTKETCNSERAQEKLNRIFNVDTNDETNENSRLKRRRTTKHDGGFKIIVIDELDLLYKEKKQNVFYSLFDWPTSADSKIILIAIANAMDLPERFMKRTGSRLGWDKLVFESYTSSCLQNILKARLGQSLLNKCFSKEAISLATMRIGRSTGDARRILDTCRLAIDRAIENGRTQVTSAEIDKVGFQNLDRQRTNFIDNCPPLELMVLKGILNEINQNGQDNITSMGVYRQLAVMVKRYFPNFTVGHNDYLALLNSLAGVGLIYLECDKPLIRKHISLVDTTDVFRDVVRAAKITV